MMKNKILTLLLALGASMLAQNNMSSPSRSSSKPNIEIMPFGGYMFGGQADLYNGKFDINGNGNYGIAIGIPVQEMMTFELSYTRMDTEVDWRPYYGSSRSYDAAVQYFQAGAVKYLKRGDVRPFVTGSLGATWIENKDETDWDDQVAFSAIVGAGVRVEMSENIALRFQGRFMVPMYFDGIGLGVGSGGVSGGAYFGAYALQGDFSAGIIYKLK